MSTHKPSDSDNNDNDKPEKNNNTDGTNNKNAVFLTGSLMRHVSVMALTSSVGLMAIFFVDFIDIFFISLLGNVSLAAAVGYAGTLLFFATSICIGVSIAAGALVARHIGAGEQQKAKEKATHVMMFGVIISVLLVALVYLFMTPLLQMVGASGEALTLAISYLSIVLPSTPFLMMAMIASANLRAYGDAKAAMYATLSGGIVNAILDPIFIFALGMDLDGAAIASFFARAAIMVTGLYPLIKRYHAFTKPNIGCFLQDVRTIGGLAFPAMLTNVATPIGLAIVTREMAHYGEGAVAGMAVIGRLTPVAFAVLFALSGAVGPIIGQNFGAHQYHRVRATLIESFKFAAIYVLLITLVLFGLKGVIADAFKLDAIGRELVYLFCGPISLLFFFNAVIFITNAAFNNLYKPLYSTVLNWLRNTVAIYPFVLLGATYMGADGVLLGQYVGGVLVAAVSVWLALRLIANYACEHYRATHDIKDKGLADAFTEQNAMTQKLGDRL